MPIAAKGEAEGRFPVEAYAELRSHGFMAVNYPEEIGGGGGDLLTGCIFYEELTRAAAGLSAGVFANLHLAAGPVLKFGDEDQKRDFALPVMKGERIGAFGLTEPDAGSDIRGIKTRARKADGGWVINGSKIYITNGSIADFIIVAARTGDDRSDRALTLFLVETSDPGVKASDLRKIGNHSSSTSYVTLDAVRVSSARVLGEVGGGLGQLKATLTEGRILVANRGLGIAQEAFESILRYAGERSTFGRVIGKHQAVAFKIADMAARIDAVRLMIYRAA